MPGARNETGTTRFSSGGFQGGDKIA
jgi:hypothetical protein